ncbi:hypothetical protein IC582_007595 [Cucumis melo]
MKFLTIHLVTHLLEASSAGKEIPYAETPSFLFKKIDFHAMFSFFFISMFFFGSFWHLLMCTFDLEELSLCFSLSMFFKS